MAGKVHHQVDKGNNTPKPPESGDTTKDIKVFDATISVQGAEVLQPENSVEISLEDIHGRAKEQALLYLPFFVFHYRYQETNFTSIMGGTSGRVCTSGFSERAPAPYVLVVGNGFGLAFIGGILELVTTPICYALVFVGAALTMVIGRAVVRTPDRGERE
ncbi:MAG: hypothetical protein LBU24_05450 [Methanocalculaceae archaeon]|nr:hypothetical protein [Methanocalculaceae archaeon]